MMIKKFYCVSALIATALFASIAPSLAAEPELVSVQKIWNAGQHNAFTDLIRYKGKWFCTFREAEGHVGGDGRIRVLASKNGEDWESSALLAEAGVDLRDPKFSITPDNRLMLVLGGSIYEGKKLRGRQPRVSFSKDGKTWTTPQRVLQEGDWLWRVTWHKGRAYGISYGTPAKGEWQVNLFESADGIDFRRVTKLDVPGQPNEATVRFLKNGDAVVLIRREAQDKAAWIGVAAAPYTEWKWQSAGMQVGGPNFIIQSNGEMIASGREYNPKPTGPKTFVGTMELDSVVPKLILPSGGDCSYAGMVWHRNLLWLSYYSSHEDRSSIYVAKIKWPKK